MIENGPFLKNSNPDRKILIKSRIGTRFCPKLTDFYRKFDNVSAWNSDFWAENIGFDRFRENIGFMKNVGKHGNLLRNNKNGSSYESLPCPPPSPCHYRPHRAEMNNLNGRLIKPKAIFIANSALGGHNCIFTWIILEIIHFFFIFAHVCVHRGSFLV